MNNIQFFLVWRIQTNIPLHLKKDKQVPMESRKQELNVMDVKIGFEPS